VPFGLVQTVAPSEEPVTLAIAKSHLRVTWNQDDDYISELLKGARDAAEHESGRQFCQATYALTLDDFPRGCEADNYDIEIRLPVGPVLGVSSITYRDEDGATQTLSTDDYAVGVRTGRIAPVSFWPATDPEAIDNVTVTFTAGYGGRDAVPGRAKDAIRLILADRYENRGDNVSNFLADREIPAAALRLLRGLGDGVQW
jgi:uncharacterized phiE125 gp8 family phage protein